MHFFLFRFRSCVLASTLIRFHSRSDFFFSSTHMDPEIDYSDSLLWCDEKWILWLFYSETKVRYCPTPKNNICNKSKSIARRESCVCLCVYVCDRHSVSFDFSGCAFGCVRSVNCHSIKWNIQIRLFLVCKWILVVDWGWRGRGRVVLNKTCEYYVLLSFTAWAPGWGWPWDKSVRRLSELVNELNESRPQRISLWNRIADGLVQFGSVGRLVGRWIGDMWHADICGCIHCIVCTKQ